MYAALFNYGNSRSPLFETKHHAIEKALDPFSIADKKGHWENNNARLFQALTWNTPESKLESVPEHCSNSDITVVAWVRLDNRTNLASKLSLEKSQLQNTTDPQLILKAYSKWGSDCVNHLLGDFSFVLHDSRNETVFAARDPVGVKPFYYWHYDKQLIVCSGARVFHAISDLQLNPDQAWLSLYILGNSTSFKNTSWTNVKKLAPGHHMHFGARETLTIKKYFEFQDNSPVIYSRSNSYVEQYRELLEESIRCRLRTDYPMGSETSGGIDSSTVTGFAANYWPGSYNDFHTFGFAFLESEPGYILETSRQHRVINNHISTGWHTDALQNTFKRTLTLLGYPEEHSNGSAHEPFYQTSEQFGIRTLLSGFGGDEVVTNSGHLLYFELIDQKKYALLMRNMPGSVFLRPARLAKALYRAYVKSTERSRIKPFMEQRWRSKLVKDDMEARFNIRNEYMKYAGYDAPYRRINDFILQNRLGPFAPTRLDNCTLMAAGRGIDYRWPLFDIRLMQQYLSTPSIEKMGNGFGRYLHRRAIQGVVPEKVQWKFDKDMGNPWQWGNQPTSNETANKVAEQLQDITSNLHEALEPVVSTEVINSFVKQASKSSSSTRVSKLNSYSAQASNLETLNSWLHIYH